MFSLKEKSAIITGGGSGIGKAIAENFAKSGATVHIIDLSLEQAENTKTVIEGFGGNALVYSADVSNQGEIKAIVNEIDKVDILVNCAGIAHVGNAVNTSEEDLDRVYRVNVKGTYNCLHEVLPKFMTQNSGVILNIASIAAWVGLSDRFAYSMSKGAVFAMTLSVAKDYLQHNIRCNSISPARVHTPFVDGFIAKNYPGKEKEMFDALSKTQPIGRMGTTEEIANLALYLCSDEASFITGNDYPIDGGFIKLNS
ncbi:SDR family oxidoreductase [Pseudopedobacter sp.]|uniref:SDR family NAD(P)-dependent oxidoreductase n=1 Tax=Pseudopedobacter sp. TaxID=1936787 RepID=UPI00333EAD83